MILIGCGGVDIPVEAQKIAKYKNEIPDYIKFDSKRCNHNIKRMEEATKNIHWLYKHKNSKSYNINLYSWYKVAKSAGQEMVKYCGPSERYKAKVTIANASEMIESLSVFLDK